MVRSKAENYSIYINCWEVRHPGTQAGKPIQVKNPYAVQLQAPITQLATIEAQSCCCYMNPSRILEGIYIKPVHKC